MNQLRRRTLAASLVATAVALTLGVGGASAQAASPSISLSKPTLSPGTDKVTVNGKGFAAGGGVYVMFCQNPAGAVGTAAGRASSCNPDQATYTIWKTPVPADGTFSVVLDVQSAWGSVDCASAANCGVFVRKDHMGGATDYSQDAFAPVSFAAAAQPAPSTGAPQPAPPRGNPQAATELARTGFSTTLAAAAAIAMALGGALVLATRRRGA